MEEHSLTEIASKMRRQEIEGLLKRFTDIFEGEVTIMTETLGIGFNEIPEYQNTIKALKTYTEKAADLYVLEIQKRLGMDN